LEAIEASVKGAANEIAKAGVYRAGGPFPTD